MNISLEEYTEEEKRLTGNMIKGGKIHDKLCDYLDSIGYKEPIINDISVAVWKAVDIIVALKEELKREREAVDFYAKGFAEKELEPKPEKAYLYDQDYPIGSEKWLMRSMSDYWTGGLARETQAQRKIILEEK